MFEKIFIEKDYLDHPQALQILQRFKKAEPISIEKIEDIFGKVKKPYLQKRDTLNLFLGAKKGNIVKEAPNTYGLSGEPHYYFSQAYNCIYECDYCYLQGYFHSPDIVLYLNHDEIGAKIIETANLNQSNTRTWFHAGEYSDSLALSHLTGEIPFYFDLFSKLPNSLLELRTKSVNIKELLKFKPLKNIITSFSLSPIDRSIKNDILTPNTNLRLKAIKTLYLEHFPIGIHLDPIIYDDKVLEKYERLIKDLNEAIPLTDIEYISLGVVRFTKDVFHQVQKNYPDSDLLNQEFIKGFDGKIRYNRPMRMWIFQKIKAMLIENGMTERNIYFCMEEE